MASNAFRHGSQIFTSSLAILLNYRLVCAPRLLDTSRLRLTEFSFPCPAFSEASPCQEMACPFTQTFHLLRPKSLASSLTPLFPVPFIWFISKLFGSDLSIYFESSHFFPPDLLRYHWHKILRNVSIHHSDLIGIESDDLLLVPT